MDGVLKYENVLKSLVQKFNKGVWNEDMMQDAWVKAIECYNSCVKQHITDEDIIKAKIITWVKNYFIDDMKKKKLETCAYDDDYEVLAYIDTSLLLVELRNSINEKENEVLTYLLQGKTIDDICDCMNKSKAQIYRYIKNIKRKIHK